MAQGPVFLLGGGRDTAAFPHTYGRFAAAVGEAGTVRIACVLLDDDQRDEYVAHNTAAFATVGVTDISPIFVSPERPLRVDDLAGADGVFVGGGLTPAYHDAIVPTAGAWLPWLRDQGIPYAGFSAGAMIAPERGIIGGWKLRRGEVDVAICHEEVGEDEEHLDIRPGLGLVPFALEPHASQWGTLTRLLHAVRADLVPAGWAVDEDTMVHVAAGKITVHGLGSAYRVSRNGGALTVDILGDGDQRDVD